MSAAPSRQDPSRTRASPAGLRALGRSAVVALYTELALAPKPGLVSFVDAGSHDDMDASTFLRSLFALRGHYPAMARAGAQAVPWCDLEALGIDAERRMLRATAGVNTHRGAIFLLGLLCAGAGAARAAGQPLRAAAVRAAIAAHWGGALAQRAGERASAPSAGARAAARHGLRGISAEAAAGFPTLFDQVLPALRRSRAAGLAERAAQVQALYTAMAALDDTTLVHRGGLGALRDVQRAARAFLDAGGAAATDWECEAQALHRHCVAHRLSPGGAADTLAAAWWLARVCGPDA